VIQEVKEDGRKVTSGKRFCSEIREMITGEDEMCEHFIPTSFFWCDKIEQRINVPTCQAKQKRGDCGRCRQKSIIMEIRKFVGRNGNKTIAKKTLIKRREPITCECETKVLARKILRKRILTD
jgi:hypothetical protein